MAQPSETPGPPRALTGRQRVLRDVTEKDLPPTMAAATVTLIVCGLDLSLTATGVACDSHTDVLTPKGVGPARLDRIREDVLDHTDGADLVVVEGYSYNANYNAHQLGELGGLIRWTLWRHGISFTVVPPAALKKWATGKGNAGKDQMVACAARLGCPADNNNAVDAWLLRQMGLYALGHPQVPQTAYRDDTTARLTWPDLEGTT